MDDNQYRLCEGTVQAYVTRSSPYFFHHFGRPEYRREYPVISDSIRAKAQPIVDKLNRGEITEDEAIRQLDKIYW